MKTTNYPIFFLFLFLFACNTDKSPYKEIIKANIIKNALGVDIKPEIDSIILVGKFSVDNVTNYWIKQELNGEGNIDTLINRFMNVDNLKRSEQYNWYKWQQNRFKQLKSLNKDDILYEVVKAFYRIEVPVVKVKTPVLNYYIIGGGKIICKISEVEMQAIVSENTDLNFAYEYVQFNNEKPKLP